MTAVDVVADVLWHVQTAGLSGLLADNDDATSSPDDSFSLVLSEDALETGFKSSLLDGNGLAPGEGGPCCVSSVMP